jgi:hypothetical protein
MKPCGLQDATFSPRRRFPSATLTSPWSTGGGAAGVTGLSSLDGMDASENETTRSFRYQDKTRYRFRVRVTDKMIRCLIDDKEIVAVDHRDRRVATRIETRRKQPRGFATWESTVALRHIEIRPLTAAEIVETDEFDE